MFRFVAFLPLLLAAALAAPQLNIPQGGHQQQYHQQQQQQQQAQVYQSQSSSSSVGGSQTTAVPIVNFEDSQPGDGTFKYA